MVRLDHEPYMKHLSHPHQLELCNIIDNDQNRPLCSACKIQSSSGYMYSCKPCNFSLHTSCAEMPELITHPSHPNHTLSLLPISSYPQGQFNCDACNRRGNGFSYHCKLCDFDLHILCASKPLSVNNQFHPNHPLQLTFSPPYGTKGFSCDICKNLGAKQWLYRCNVCEFDVHLDCSTATPTPRAQPQPPPPLHHFHSLPGMSTYLHQHQQPNYLMHSASLGAQPSNQQVPGMSSTYHQQQQQQPNYIMHSASLGAQPSNQQVPGISTYQQQQQPNYMMHSASLGAQPSNQQVYANNNLTNAMVQGFVEGAAQQVGQNFMQSVIGGGTGNGDCGDVNDAGNGDSSSGSIFSVGSSLLSSMLGEDSQA